jgi:ElaB/YqjD/DUF883 family membrane-anchored ribosome-binding protein
LKERKQMTRKTHKDDLHEESAAPKDELEAIAENAGRYARKVLDETQGLGEHADAFVALIREKPIQSALIALGIGALLGVVIRR